MIIGLPHKWTYVADGPMFEGLTGLQKVAVYKICAQAFTEGVAAAQDQMREALGFADGVRRLEEGH